MIRALWTVVKVGAILWVAFILARSHPPMNPRTKREKAIYHGFIQGYSFGYVLGRAPELVSKTINAAIGRCPDCGEVTDHRPDCPSIRRSKK